MKTRSYHTILIFVLVFCFACSVRRRIPKGEFLYAGAVAKTDLAHGADQSSFELKNKLKDIAYPKRNKILFGEPYKVWWWYVIGASKKEKGFKHWLRNKIGEAPVFFSTVNMNSNAQNMEAYLENEGYFNSKVTADTAINGYKAKAVYSARIERPYMISSVQWRLDSSQVSKDIMHLPDDKDKSLKGKRYTVDGIKAETERISQLLKDRGYYYFRPQDLITYVDTNHRNYTASIHMAVDEKTSSYIKQPYHVNQIVAVVSSQSWDVVADSVIKRLPNHDGIALMDSARKFKPYVLTKGILLRPGLLYSQSEQNQTITRLNSYGVFKFIKTDFRRVNDSTGNEFLNGYYYTSPHKEKTLQFETGAFAKSNNYYGGEASFSWKHNNIFRGAETLTIQPKGSFELSYNDSLKNNNTWRLGIQTELSFPKLMAPWLGRKNFTYIPKTKIIGSYDWLRRQNLYTEYYLHGRYELLWSNKPNIQHRLIPFSITHRTSGNIAEDFLIGSSIDQKLEYSLPASFIPASSYNFLISNAGIKRKKIYYLQTAIETSGFLFGLIKGNSGPFTTKIGDAQLMQYLRGEFEIRNTEKLGKLDWVNRLFLGGSYIYGNSVFLPFFKQFIIGGANSLRGFIPRELGPGSAKATAEQISYYPQIGGDYKLEMNTELRFGLGGRLKGAFFMDAGNIWMKDSLLYGEQGKLTKNFWKELAIDAGTGLRLDFSVLILRLDLGIPFYKPWLPEGDRWTFKDFDVGSSQWRKENLVLNVAIGYPF